MIFNTWARFHAATNIDCKRLNFADRLGDIVGAQAAGKNNPTGVDASQPFPREHLSRTTVPRGKGIEQVIIRRKLVQSGKRSLRFDAKRFDDFHLPVCTVVLSSSP